MNRLQDLMRYNFKDAVKYARQKIAEIKRAREEGGQSPERDRQGDRRTSGDNNN